MSHEIFDALLAAGVGTIVWLAKLLIGRHFIRQDAIEGRLKELEEWYAAQQAITRHPIRLNGGPHPERDNKDLDSDQDDDTPNPDPPRRRVRGGKSSSE